MAEDYIKQLAEKLEELAELCADTAKGLRRLDESLPQSKAKLVIGNDA